MIISRKELQALYPLSCNDLTTEGVVSKIESSTGIKINLVNDTEPLEIPPPGFMAKDNSDKNAWNQHFAEKENPVLKSTRQQILEEAIQCVTKDRNASHGECEDNFQNIADFWNIWIKMRMHIGIRLEKHDVAVMMDLMKTSRLIQSPENRDHWVDKAGYSACGAQCIVNNESHPMDLPK